MLPVVGANDNTGNTKKKVSLIPCVLKKKIINYKSINFWDEMRLG